MPKEAEDDLGELDDLGIDAASLKSMGDTKKAKAKKKGAEPGAPPLILRIVLGLSGVMLVAGFFLPWIRLEAINPERSARLAQTEAPTFVSGLEIAVGGNTLITTVTAAAPWEVLFLIPLLGAALAAVGFLGNRWSGVIGAALGVLIVGYGLVTVILLFFSTTSYGLWIVLGGAFVAVAAGTLAWVRGRQPKSPALAIDK